MDGEDVTLIANSEKEEYESSSHSTPHEHKTFAEFAKDKLDSGKLNDDSFISQRWSIFKDFNELIAEKS